MDYPPISGKLTKITEYTTKDSHLDYIYYCNYITGKKLEEISYKSYNDSLKISYITNYDPVAGKKLRFTKFQNDGTDYCHKYDTKTCK